METRNSSWIRWGVVTLPFIAVLDLVGMFLRGPVIDATTNAQGFAQSAVAPSFGTAWLIILIAQAVTLLSFLALYGVLDQTRTAKLALVLSVMGVALFTSLLGFMAFAAPIAAKFYLQGDTNMLDVIVAGFYSGPVTGVLYSSGSLGALGSVLFGVAIWRSGTLPKWASIPYALSYILLAFASPFSLALEAVGGVLLLGSGVWIAITVWQSASAALHGELPARNDNPQLGL